jgi:hypothetical protein
VASVQRGRSSGTQQQALAGTPSPAPAPSRIPSSPRRRKGNNSGTALPGGRGQKKNAFKSRETAHAEFDTPIAGALHVTTEAEAEGELDEAPHLLAYYGVVASKRD